MDTVSKAGNPESGGRAARRDFDAGDLLRELREGRHLTREEMPREMRKAGIRRDYVPCSKSLGRYEDQGVIPTERKRFGLAIFFERPVNSIWDLTADRDAARERVAA